MKKILFKTSLALLFLTSASSNAIANNTQQWGVTSPNGEVNITVTQRKGLTYTVKHGKTIAIEPSEMGFVIDGKTIGDNTELVSATQPKEIKEEYTLKSGKRLQTLNHCIERTLTFKDRQGKTFDIVLRAYNDGVAFRYAITQKDEKTHCISEELTEFAVPTQGKAWIHPYIVADGVISYEEWAESDIAIRSAAPQESGWAFPMLFNTNKLWLLVTEAELDGNYPATHTDNSGQSNAYKIRFPEKTEKKFPDAPQALTALPWKSPWRVIAVGDKLNDIFATQIVTHLNPPSHITDLSWIKPGRTSWSWWSEKRAKNYHRQVEYINLSKELDWEYVLMDEGWPQMQKEKGGDVVDAVNYACSKGVGTWLWYASFAGMEHATVGRDGIPVIMSKPEVRRQEMKRISELGVKGIKVDFFDTDKQQAIQLSRAILEDAADFQLMVNLHGCTLPRGWERTYPHLMTMEAVKGAEGMGQQARCDIAPSHHTILPFTRNAVGSMDYTPLTFSIKRPNAKNPAIPRTTYAHQLALSVVFESGLQCFADNEKTYRSMPEPVKAFLRKVPCAWDESLLLAGQPGRYVIVLRRLGRNWYIGGINGLDKKQTISFALPEELKNKKISIIKDGNNNREFGYDDIQSRNGKITMELPAYGGFCGTF